MPALCLLTPRTHVSLRGERLIIECPNDETDENIRTAEIPLREIEQVLLTESVHITMPALMTLVEREIPVVLTYRGERVVGLCLPPAPHSAVRLAQYRRLSEPAFVLDVARAIVRAKISNERRVLQRLAANRSENEAADCTAFLNKLLNDLQSSDNVESIRGIEGAAAAAYFETLARFFPKDCPFERRSRRPPHNPPNAILSYVYAILCAELECLILSSGLDPALGFLHQPEDRRPSLALDLVEPFRAAIGDALALDLLNHGSLNPRDHFEQREGGVYLNLAGRKRFYVKYETRMTRDFFHEQRQRRTTLRMALREDVLLIKRAILEGAAAFEPFLMN